MYNKLRNERLKALTLNSWLIFKQNHHTAKNYFYRVFTRLDLSMKRQAVKQWKEKTQIDAELSLHTHENVIIETIEDLNHQIGGL